MRCISLAILSMFAFGAPQQADAPAERGAKTFAERAKIATSAPALFLVEWLIVPGLEMIDDAADDVPEFKGFTAELIKVLHSDEARSRSAALNYLAGLARLVRLTAWWRDRDDGNDLFATALGKHAAPIRLGLETAIRNTTGNDRLLAAVALLALVDEDKAAVDRVVDELRCPDARRRQEACDWVGHIRLSQRPLVTALAAATTDKELKVRCAAAIALLQIGPKAASAVPAVLAYLKSGEATTDEVLKETRLAPMVMGIPTINAECSAIGRNLADLKPAVTAVIELLEAGSANKRQIVFACLARLGPDAGTAVTAIEPYLRDQDMERRLTAAATILCINPDHAGATAELVGFIKSVDATLPARAIEVCGDIAPKTKPLVPLLIESLKDDAESTRLSAAQALGKMGSLAEPAIPRLAALLISKRSDDTDMRVQYTAACALVGIGKEGLTALLDHLAKPSTTIHSSGYGAMHLALAECKQDSTTVVPVLICVLDDKNPAVRMQAAAALGRLKRLAAPSREALLRETRRTDRYDIFRAGPTLAGWALTQVTR